MSDTLPYAHLLKRQPEQARSAARIEGLLDAAAAMLRDQEPEQITVRDLAAAAGVPTGTLYQFFTDKDAVLQALAIRYLSVMPQLLDDAVAPGPGDWADAIDRVVERYAEMIRAHPAIRRLWLSGTLNGATRHIERQTDATIAARLGTLLIEKTGGSAGTPAEWSTLVALIDGLLRHAFTLDPDGDESVLREARRAARAYAALVLGLGEGAPAAPRPPDVPTA